MDGAPSPFISPRTTPACHNDETRHLQHPSPIPSHPLRGY
ncbi:hypothetical protein ACP70R_045207 [Stipagrostis hirtigluma subsp. patula]